ncbi:hypothetical protein EJB05_40412, partial [Eragrostis curvula]
MAASPIVPFRLSLIVLFFSALLAAATCKTADARPTMFSPAPTPALAAWSQGLDGAEGPQQCWDALVEMKSCTGEIILFLINGEAHMGPDCCRAIRVVEQRCWAADAVMSMLGFTPEEGDMLKGYCDAGDHGASPPLPPNNDAAVDVARDRSAVDSVAGRKGSVHR